MRRIALGFLMVTVAVASQLVSAQDSIGSSGGQSAQGPPTISGTGQSIGGGGASQGTPDAAPPPDFGAASACKSGKMDLAKDRDGLQKQLQDLTDKIKGDQTALRRLRLENRAQSFEDENKLASCAKADLQQQSIGALIKGAGAWVKDIGPGNRILSPGVAKQVIENMKAAQLNNPELLRYISGLAGTPAGKEALIELTDQLDKANDMAGLKNDKEDIQGTGDNCGATRLEPWLDGSGTLLGWVKFGQPGTPFSVGSPEFETAKGYVDMARFIVFGGYDASTYYLSKQNVDALDALTDQDLRVVQMWKDKLVSDVSCLKETQAALNNPQAPVTARAAHSNTGAWILGGTLLGGAAVAGVAGAEALSHTNSATSTSGGGSDVVTGQCTGTSNSNACGTCTCNLNSSGPSGCTDSSQCPGGGCWTGGRAPFC
jgi:hypothetical protein